MNKKEMGYSTNIVCVYKVVTVPTALSTLEKVYFNLNCIMLYPLYILD